MIKHAGIALFIFGNKGDGKGGWCNSDGMIEEYELAIKQGVIPIPVGATGYISEELWKRAMATTNLYPDNSDLNIALQKIGDSSLNEDELINYILQAISILQTHF